jgi:hypothetical protein
LIEPLNDIPQAMAFLKRHEETSQFLINNLRDRGPRVTDDPYSGNFKVIKNGNQIVAVFYVARCGNVYAQAESDQYTDLILDGCKTEPFLIKGFLGAWSILNPIYEKFLSENPQFKPSYKSKEILYRLPLSSNDSRLKRHPEVRLLTKADFEDWLPLRNAYMEELHLTGDSNAEQVKSRFERSTQNKTWWGFFRNKTLISIAGLNSKSEQIGQVGGVFTPKEERMRGYSKATMLHLLRDCCELHGHTKSILFTGETDVQAQRLYELIGYERIGHFALILSE